MAAAGGCDEVQAGRRPVRRWGGERGRTRQQRGVVPGAQLLREQCEEGEDVATVAVRTAQVDLRVFVVIVLVRGRLGLGVDLLAGRSTSAIAEAGQASALTIRSSGPAPITSATSLRG